MTPVLQITSLVIATIFAGAAAVAFHWLLLRTAFHLMRPATARRVSVRSLATQGRQELVRGTVLLARALDPRK